MEIKKIHLQGEDSLSEQLDNSYVLRFIWDRFTWIDIDLIRSAETKSLHIRGSRGILIKPEASNSIEIKIDER